MIIFSNMSLGKKILFLTVVGLVIGIGILGSLGLHAVNQATDVMLQDRLTTASLLGDYLDETLSYARAELEFAAGNIDPSTSSDAIQPRLDSMEAALKRLSILSKGIYIVDSAGQVLLSRPLQPAVTNLSAYPPVKEALASSKSTVSALARAPLSNTPVIFISSPLKGGNGILTVAVDPVQSSIGGLVRPIRLGQTGYVEVVDSNGIVVTRTEPGPKLSSFEQSDHSGRFAVLISAGKPTRGVCHTCHEPQQKVARRDVLAFVPLSRTNWGVVIRQSEDEALTPVNQLRQNLILFGAGLGLVAMFFALVLTRDFVRRIGVLSNASQRIANGDLASPVMSSGKDEISLLARSFDDMRLKLSSSYGELEKKTRELASLLSVSEILNSTSDLSTLLQAVVARAVEVIPGAAAGALLLPDGRHALKLECAVGLDKSALPQTVPCNPDEGAMAVEHAVASFVGSELLRTRVKTHIYAQVSAKGQCGGTLIVLKLENDEAFTRSDQRLLQAIADNIAVVLEKEQLTREAEEARALHEADKLQKEFISSVSHELRMPLTMIKGCSTSLLREDTSWDNESQKQFLHIINEKTDDLGDLIDKLLESAKQEAGAVRLEKEPLLLPQLARKIVEEIAGRAKDHQFVINFSHHFPVIEADVRCMRQVLHNLLENAVKYSPDGGEVVVSGVVQDSQMVVSVRDHGVGIPLEAQNKLFERFYRVKTPETHRIPGNGLGLAIVKGHIEAHGGRVWVDSAPGQGSTFFFSLPLDPVNNNMEEDKQT